MKKNQGITLVALVITIIILLILAGISIAALTGSGLFENAKLAEQKSKEAQEKEEGILSDYENKIGKYLEGGRAVAESELILDVKPRLDFSNGTSLKIGADITAENDSDIWGFMVLINGEVKEWGKSKDENVTISDLEVDTEYAVSVIAVDKYGNIKKSSEEKYRTKNALEYSVITSTGIYNFKKNSEYVLDLELDDSPYASNALPKEAYDNDTSTVIYGTVYNDHLESEYKYLNVDSSAIGKTLQVTFGASSGSFCYGSVYSVTKDGTKTLLGNSNGNFLCTIPEDCNQIAIIMQVSCYVVEMEVVE